MSDQNPYSTPDASLDSKQSGGTHNPSIFSFSGRIGRLRYLAYSIAITLILMVAITPIVGTSMFMSTGTEMSLVTLIAIIAFYVLSILFTVMYGKRRLNDLNRSGWFVLLFIIPIVNLILAIYLIFFRGTDGDNDYGSKAKPNTLGVKLLAFLLPALFIIGIVAAIALPMMQGNMGQ